MIEAPSLTRRRLLTYGGAAAATMMLPGVARAGSTPVTKNSWLERGTYNSRVGQRFGMSSPGGTVALTLSAVLDLVGETANGRPLAGRNDAFALAFTGPAGATGFQETRQFTHPTLGQHPLFVIAGRGVDGPLLYIVTVNRSA
jgi:hypothetical protein